ncbi:MAG: hypothetical protein HKN62_14985 [Phycisphaerales bacterium]|nr:hypothetical protein [Phycisphaerales bacterium]
MVRTPVGVRLCPSRYPLVLGLVFAGVFVAAGVIFHEPIGAIVRAVSDRGFLPAWLILVLLAIPVSIACVGLMAMYPLALRFGTSVEFDMSRSEVRITTGRDTTAVALGDVRAIQICASAFGRQERRVVAYEMNLVTESESGLIERRCLLCGGPRSALRRLAERLASLTGKPVVDST